MLAARGRDVLLVDRHRFPRAKACGECVNPGGVAMLDRLGLRRAAERTGPVPLRGWALETPAGRRAWVGFAPPVVGWGIDRATFDLALLNEARRRGVRVREGVRVNSVAPGETITPEAEAELANDPDERRLVREYLRRIPLQHTGVPRDQAMAVLFLASDDARFVSAQTLIVDGGELGGGDWYDVADAPPLPPEDRPITG